MEVINQENLQGVFRAEETVQGGLETKTIWSQKQQKKEKNKPKKNTKKKKKRKTEKQKTNKRKQHSLDYTVTGVGIISNSGR